MKVRTTFFFLALLLTTHLCARRAAALGFKCSSATTHTCQSMVGYIASTNTTLAAVATKFGLRSYAVLLGPNSLPLSASGHHPVGSGQTVRVPIPCRCTGGSGYSDRVPVHTVQDNEYLYVIAMEVFSSLVDYPSIAAVNRIPDPRTIHKGQRLWIPLPCSCDPVGKKFPVIHYAHVVLPGSSLNGIAAQFGDDEGQIMKLNGIENPNLLAAGQVLDIPLRVCSSQIRNSSLDKSLAVAGGSYALTANNCVQCKCSNSWQLQCEPNPVANVSTCPSMRCKGTNMVIGDSVTGTGCGSPTCSYAGYTNQSILTAITAGATCVPAGEFTFYC
ncbi:hypothetical protein EJ110_NYTH00888 [Nymphaea thermarum]|nr:hypothetical protein EJ110_NYTH00888 [Nymphaea thermarum]